MLNVLEISVVLRVRILFDSHVRLKLETELVFWPIASLSRQTSEA